MTLPRAARNAGAFREPPDLPEDPPRSGLTLVEPDLPAMIPGGLPVLGSSRELRAAIDTARRVALTDASVFITGESGTGKELIAQYIHAHSLRRRAPFVPVNCAALPEALFESELFGHRRGAFTGAVRDKPGILETAHQGTLFLDELVEMPPSIQAKLLRVLQDGVLRRVGSESSDTAVDVRVIAATNSDPADAVRRGRLRQDLLFRIDVVPIHLAPLRDRPEDIPLLVQHFLKRYWARHRGSSAPPPTLTSEATWALSAHPWPGNVRELQNTIEHLTVIAEPGARIGPDAIPFRRALSASAAASEAADSAADPAMDRSFTAGYRAAREQIIAAFEARYLQWFVRRAGRNFSKASRIAGIDRTTLYRLLERHGLERPPRPPRPSGG